MLVRKKTKIQKETNEEVSKLKEVENNQRKELDIKDKEIALLKKTAATEKDKYKKDLGTLQNRTGELVKENNNLNTMLNEKESIIKALEEQTNSTPEDVNDSVVVDEVVQMRNNQSENKCTACNKRFSTNNDLERHISDKHNEVECPFCSNMFPNKSKLRDHVNNCSDNGTANVNCTKCHKIFTRLGLGKHMKQCQKKKEVKRNECGMLANTAAEIKSHMSREHSTVIEKSKEICYHYRNGFCFRGDSCRFSHVGHQKGSLSGSTSRPATARNWTPACTRGESCSWLARGACKFFHRGVGVQRPDKSQQNTNQTSGSSENRRSFSTNSLSGFPPLRRANQHMRRNGGRN